MRRTHIVIVTLFCFTLLLPGLTIMVSADRLFSDEENRPLAQQPHLSWQSIRSGRYMNNFARYLSDQFPLRSSFISLRTTMDRAMLKEESNGVYFGADGYLLEKLSTPSDSLWKSLDELNNLVTKLPARRVSFLLVPTSATVHVDKLPRHAPQFDQGEVISQIRQRVDQSVLFPDLLSTFRQRADEDIFFRTDHHWTPLGAYYAYQELMQQWNLPVPSQDRFLKQTVSEDFYGTYYYRINDRKVVPDELQIWKLQPEVRHSVSIPNTYLTELYDWEKLATNDKYAVFLGGNHPLAIVESEVDNDYELLLIKDSYANCLIPLLANHYKKIHVIDPRYFQADIAQYAADHDLQDALFVYGMTTMLAK